VVVSVTSPRTHCFKLWLSFILPVGPSCPKSPFDPLAVVFLPHLPLRRTLDSQVPTERVTEAWTTTEDVTKHTIATVTADRVDVETVVVITGLHTRSETEMTNNDVTGAAVVNAKSTRTETTAATTATDTTAAEKKMPRTAGREEEEHGLRETIALLSGPRPLHLTLTLGAQVPDTMTTPAEILLRHHQTATTDTGGQILHPRMLPLGGSRKTCTEGMAGWTRGLTTLNGK